MSSQLKAPPVYKPDAQRLAAPQVYRPTTVHQVTQPKQSNLFQLENRPAPPVYKPQQGGVSATQAKPSPAAHSLCPQAQYELSSPVWIGNGRQQIRVVVKGTPTPIGSVDVHYKQGGKAFISDLEVAQAHRRHGLGTMLMKAAVESARRNGSIATELEANPGPGSLSKQSLVGIYQKLGFRNAGFTRRGNPLMTSGARMGQIQRATHAIAALSRSSAAFAPSSIVQRAIAPNVVTDFYLDAYEGRMNFRPRTDIAGYRQGIAQNWTNAFFSLEDALDRNRRGVIDFQTVLPHYQNLLALGSVPLRAVSREETTARRILADMNRQFGAWDSTLQNRGAYWGAANPGSAVGARTIDQDVMEYLRPLAEAAGWTFSNSVSSGVSFHRTRGDSPHTFIYHAAAPG